MRNKAQGVGEYCDHARRHGPTPRSLTYGSSKPNTGPRTGIWEIMVGDDRFCVVRSCGGSGVGARLGFAASLCDVAFASFCSPRLLLSDRDRGFRLVFDVAGSYRLDRIPPLWRWSGSRRQRRLRLLHRCRASVMGVAARQIDRLVRRRWRFNRRTVDGADDVTLGVAVGAAFPCGSLALH